MTMSGDLEEIAMAMGRHGSGFDAPELAGSWLLIVESTANISRLLAERSFITEMVAGFEGAGFEGAGFEGAGFEGAGVTKSSGADMPEEAGELGIISGRRRTGASPPHRIGFWAAPQGWSFGSASVVDEVVAAAVDDKGDQLARVIDETPITAEELHLFVWVMPELIDAFDTLLSASTSGPAPTGAVARDRQGLGGALRPSRRRPSVEPGQGRPCVDRDRDRLARGMAAGIILRDRRGSARVRGRGSRSPLSGSSRTRQAFAPQSLGRLAWPVSLRRRIG